MRKILGLTEETINKAVKVRIKRFKNHDRVYLTLIRSQIPELGMTAKLEASFTLFCHVEKLNEPLRSLILKKAKNKSK